jgi:hypothetical protein
MRTKRVQLTQIRVIAHELRERYTLSFTANGQHVVRSDFRTFEFMTCANGAFGGQ